MRMASSGARRATRSRAVWRRLTRIASAIVISGASASGCAGGSSLSLGFAGTAAVPLPGFATIVGPVTGSGSRTFAITAPGALSYNLTCLGHRQIWLRTAPDVVGFAVYCDDGHVTGGDWLNTPATDIGVLVRVRITAPAATTWELRIDGSKHAQPEPG